MKSHLAGIVPVTGIRTDFNMPWHASLMPIGPNYLAVERSVAECAYAGCDTIWVVCGDEVAPLIRYQLGEKIQDPVYSYRHFETNKTDVRKPIRIYYVPVAIKDINKRDNLAWSAIHGAQVSHNILKSLSVHLAPKRFYISWPYGYYNPRVVRPNRKTISSEDVVLQHDNKTIANNCYLGMSIGLDHISQLVSESISTSSGLWNEDRSSRLPLEERYSYKNYNLQTVFKNLDFSNFKKIEAEDYMAIDCWQQYCQFLSIYKEIKKPTILRYSEWNETGLDDVQPFYEPPKR